MADTKNQGEGNREAAKVYNEKTEEFIKSGRVEEAAQQAKEAVEGSEREELEEAEKKGKEHIKGIDPNAKREF